MHHQKLPVKIGLNASEVAISTLRTRSAPERRPKTIEDTDLQALLDEDDTRSICGGIKHDSPRYFQMFTCHGKNLKGRKMGAA